MLPPETLSLDTQGNWFHGGVPFTNIKLANLFSRSIIFCPKRNDFILKIGNDEALFLYEKTPFIALTVDYRNDEVILVLNTGQELILDDATYFFYDNNGFYAQSSQLIARIRRDLYQLLSINIINESKIKIFDKQFQIHTEGVHL